MKRENEIEFSDYKKSVSYGIIEDIMISGDIDKSYVDIILYHAFVAGWIAAHEHLLNKTNADEKH